MTSLRGNYSLSHLYSLPLLTKYILPDLPIICDATILNLSVIDILHCHLENNIIWNIYIECETSRNVVCHTSLRHNKDAIHSPNGKFDEAPHGWLNKELLTIIAPRKSRDIFRGMKRITFYLHKMIIFPNGWKEGQRTKYPRYVVVVNSPSTQKLYIMVLYHISTLR